MDWEGEFYGFIMEIICKEGGTRLQMQAADIINEMQKLPPKHPVNMHRKQYGNLQQCLKTCKKPFFIFQDNIVKLLPKEQIDKIAQFVPQYDLYCQNYVTVLEKICQVLKVNRMNECLRCKQQYRIDFNKQNSCEDNFHNPKFDIQY
ncbi:hypothetical protein pb186bvf_017818 [Paramecium bursaria]